MCGFYDHIKEFTFRKGGEGPPPSFPLWLDPCNDCKEKIMQNPRVGGWEALLIPLSTGSDVMLLHSTESSLSD